MSETLFLLGALGLAAILAVRVGLRSRSARAEGLQHAPAPGEVSGQPLPAPPSPGEPTLRDCAHATATACGVNPELIDAHMDQVVAEHLGGLPDSELLQRAAAAVDLAARRTPVVRVTNDLLTLADALRDRAAQFAALEALDTP